MRRAILFSILHCCVTGQGLPAGRGAWNGIMTDKPSQNLRRRYLALWFPYLASDRQRRHERPHDGGGAREPLVFVEKIKNAMRLAAVSPDARALGLHPGLTLADARARVPAIRVMAFDPAGDSRWLERLADQSDCFTPLVAAEHPQGLMLDITGCAHLWGGEDALLTAVYRQFRSQGLHLCGSIAGTPDAARVLARCGRTGIIPPGEEARAVRPLPVAALDLGPDIHLALHRAGLKSIGDLAARSSQPLTARFGEDLPRRLRRTLGREDIRIIPRRPPPPVRADQRFAEPIARTEDIEAALAHLAGQVADELARRGAGGRLFEAGFFRSDGAVRRVAVETARPVRDAGTVMRLYREKIESLADPIDPGFGFDLIRLSVPRLETLQSRQSDLDGLLAGHDDVADLVDRLGARLGRNRVLRFVPRDSHDPQRAAYAVPAADDRKAHMAWPQPERGEPPTRPLQLFDPPQLIEALAEVPDGPPLRFRWRRVLHDIIRSEGPERIAPEWWRHNPHPLTRDYYRVEDRQGRRFWLFRAGLYEDETAAPRWYLHGLFS